MNHLVSLSILLFTLPAMAQAVPSELRIQTPARAQRVTLQELRSKLKVIALTVNDPVYKKKKTYEGFALVDVLKLGGMDSGQGDEIVFRCADGYSPTLLFSKLAGKKGILAFREKGRKEYWESLQQGKTTMTPGPFYVVWDTPAENLPWPYQVIGLEVIRFAEKYDRIFPKGEPQTSATFKGFQIFKNDCLRCHSLNLQGGDLGPELNIPKNITEYRQDAFLVDFIRNSAEFRARSKMPPFPQLKDDELQAILEYLKFMKKMKRAD